jgi:hypothetical protein
MATNKAKDKRLCLSEKLSLHQLFDPLYVQQTICLVFEFLQSNKLFDSDIRAKHSTFQGIQ